MSKTINPSWSQDAYIHALRFAATAHQGQKYPGTDLPYLMHLNFVSMEVMAALSVETANNPDLAVQCAILHDVLEDTQMTYHQLATEFGEKVAQGVKALTKDPSLPKPLQMVDSLKRIQVQPFEIWMVKLADRISNLQTPPSYWTNEKIIQYREEAILIYESLKTGSTYLANRLMDKMEKYREFVQ
ncbi:bifunctional (p)ppGpp synthetase/guanosine-3',5'-bis(diphosphate) 3'-pyrophosphohydrolase [candidate division KSB1 bacterium]|nr:bifunctional (p)ppGpp synthetase/guanosine-3',5'-bis(diphosphate) 3'-pyrophosphohydrolase [candidate division KSB1 bacterium]